MERKKLMIKYMKNKWIKWIIIPFALFFFAYWMSLLFNPSTEFSVLIHDFTRKNFIHFTSKRLMAGDMVDATFISSDNNLGIVAVRFYNFKQISNDIVLFRIKDVNGKAWYYQNYYRVDQFQPNKPFTFGFPTIADSAGKKYYFQIISTKGTKHDSIGVSPLEPVFITKSQFTKNYLLSNWKNLLIYIAKRTANIVENRRLYYFSIIYFAPLSWYLALELLSIKKVKKKLEYVIAMPVVGLLLYATIAGEEVLGILFIFLGIWFIITKLYDLAPSVTFSAALIFLIISPIFQVLNKRLSAENAAMIAFYFLLIALVQLLLNPFLKTKFKVEYDKVIRKIFFRDK